jgi:hypothetical protein
MTDSQLASLSWCQVPVWGLQPDFYYHQTVAGLLMQGALSDERMGLPFTIAAGPRQHSQKFTLRLWRWRHVTPKSGSIWIPQCYNSTDCTLRSHRCKNIKSYFLKLYILRWNNPLLDNGLLKHISQKLTRLEESKHCPKWIRGFWDNTFMKHSNGTLGGSVFYPGSVEFNVWAVIIDCNFKEVSLNPIIKSWTHYYSSCNSITHDNIYDFPLTL